MIHNTMSRRRLIALAGAGALGAAMGNGFRMPRASAAIADQYELIDLGVTDEIGETTLGFNDMNADGVIVGNMDIDGTKNSPFVFKDGELTRIKTGEFGARASCINASGVIGGRDLRGWHTEEQPWGRPVIWVDGEKEVLPFPDGLPSPGEEGRVYDINDEGVAVGDVSIANGVTVPVVWRNGQAEILDGYNPGGSGTAHHINNSGMIVGDLTGQGDETGGAVWSEIGYERLQFSPVSGATMFGYGGLTESDRILGALKFGEKYVASYLDGVGAEPITLAEGVENEQFAFIYCSLGDNVFGGYSSTVEKSQAFLWIDGVPVELKTLVKNTRGLRLEYVVRFSQDGWIGGNAIDKDGARHPYLLIPA